VLWFYALTLLITILGSAFYFYRKNRGREASAPEIDDLKKGYGGRRPLPGANLRKDNLSKEVELDWEASEIIEFQPGAWALPKDAAPDSYEETDSETRETKREKHAEKYSLPAKYGANRLVLLARDPSWIYAYWDISHEKYQDMYRRHLTQWEVSRPLLRLYDVTSGTRGENLDVYVDDAADNWYIRVAKPRHKFMAEFGVLFPGGFVPMLQSNVVQLPPYGVSPVTSLEWAPLDWESHYGRDGGLCGVSSPMDWGGKIID
jgi:hypothetical protein